jgi:RNA polymerase sigma factor (sigma-70 family)
VRWSARVLASFRDGDAEVLDHVYRSHVRVVTRVVASTLRRYGGKASIWRGIGCDLPDLVQEVFARAFAPKTRSRFDGVRDYSKFLGQIARNIAVDHLRFRHRQQDLPSGVEQVFDAFPAWPAPRDTSDEIGDRETMNVVLDYLANLPIDLRHAHEVLYERGLSEREAAAALGVGRQVIRTLGTRLRDGLRRALETDDEAGARPVRDSIQTEPTQSDE